MSPNVPTKQPKPKLLKCPFCGGRPKLYFQLDDLGDYKVMCDGCGASTCPEGIRTSKQQAINDWNIRK